MTLQAFLFCHLYIKVITMNSVKYSIDAYHRYISRATFVVFFRELKFLSMVIATMLYFPGFLTISYRFHWCFRMFLPVFLRFPSVFLLVPLGVCCFLF